MPRIRSVHPDICTDQGLVGLSGDAERLFVRLWTHLDDDGRCEDDLLLLKAALFPRHRHIGEGDIERWLDELVANGQVIRYERNGKRLLTVKPDRWSTWQKPRRKVDSKLPAPTRADIVGTRSDNDGTRAAGGVDGGETETKMEGEFEGEVEPRASCASPVDNPTVLTWVERAEARAREASERNPAAGADAVVVSFAGPRTSGEAS